MFVIPGSTYFWQDIALWLYTTVTGRNIYCCFGHRLGTFVWLIYFYWSKSVRISPLGNTSTKYLRKLINYSRGDNKHKKLKYFGGKVYQCTTRISMYIEIPGYQHIYIYIYIIKNLFSIHVGVLSNGKYFVLRHKWFFWFDSSNMRNSALWLTIALPSLDTDRSMSTIFVCYICYKPSSTNCLMILLSTLRNIVCITCIIEKVIVVTKQLIQTP